MVSGLQHVGLPQNCVESFFRVHVHFILTTLASISRYINYESHQFKSFSSGNISYNVILSYCSIR